MARLPEESYKHDPSAADDFMADWISRQDAARREKLLEELQAWLQDHEHPWHDHATLEIAVRLRHGPLVAAAVAEASRLGVHDEARDASGRMAPWLSFHLHLIGSINKFPTADGVEYLRRLRSLCDTAMSDARREVGIRAWITACAVGDPTDEGSCLSEAVERLRAWSSERVTRSALGLLGAYYAHNARAGSLLRSLLTPEEAKVAMQ